MITILNQMADKWYSWEIAMLWQAGLLIAIVEVIDLMIKRWAWPQVRYALWMLILVKLVLPPSLTSPTSFTAEIPFMVKQAAVKINQPEVAESTNSDIKPIPAAAAPKRVEIASPEARNEEILRFAQNDNRTRNDIAVPAMAKQADKVFRQDILGWKIYLMFVWLGGAAILTGWLVIRLGGLRREQLDGEQILPERLEGLLSSTAAKLGLKKIPRIILTDSVHCPAVFGVFRPVLLMPAGKLANMTTQDAENIFLHELAHIKRGDLFVHAVYMILQIAYWFNPMVWLVRKPMQNLRELCCDATVARLLREKTASYRQTLLDTARELLAVPVEPGMGLLGLFENSSWLLDRLRWLEKKSWKYLPLRIATVFVLICLMSACVLPMAKYNAPVDFVIKGTVTDADTGKPIAGAKVGDNGYSDENFGTVTDESGDYSYKTWYEEHNVKAAANGYKEQRVTLLTKLFGKEKEKVINFKLKPEVQTDVQIERVEQQGVKTEEYNESVSGQDEDENNFFNNLFLQGRITHLTRIKNIMMTLSGTLNAAHRVSFEDNSPDSAAKIMEEALPQFKKFELSVKGMTYSEAVHLIIERIEQAIKANKEDDSIRVEALIEASCDSWDNLLGALTEEIDAVADEIREQKQKARHKGSLQKAKEDSQKSTGQSEATSETNNIPEKSAAETTAKKARTLRVRIYEGDAKEPQTDVNIPLTAVKILRQILPSKDTMQVIAKSIELDDSLPEDVNSAMLIDVLDATLKQLDAGIEAATLVEAKDGDERIIIALE
ncbi:MAG: carboxypeptidase-like regulatory domain-containing protein [Sedimentisphaerales bacterium]|nr:carboxypeptidase-like regulatory domain-containing protein [Sedimentisphaerales bacterium]